jgi:hypothetical protein
MSNKSADHLCNYFVLPLIGYNKFSFGEGNFVNSYITLEEEIVVILKTIPQVAYHTNPNYKADFDVEGKFAIVFTIPTTHIPDFYTFLDGRYSKLSDKAKQLIKQNSGLRYNIPDPQKPGNVICDEKLLAMDNSPAYRKKLEENLNVIIPNDVELLSRPSASEIIVKHRALPTF